jgi:uncharacterized protein (DUF983 family)
MRLLAKCLFLQYEFTNSLVNIDNISCFDDNNKLYVLPLNVLRHIVSHVCEVFVYIATCTPHIFNFGIFPRFLQMHFKCTTCSHDYDFEWLKDLMIVELGMSMNCLPFRSTWVHCRFFGVVRVSPSLVLCFFCVVDHCFFFSFGHCVVCPLIYGVTPLLSSTFCTVFATRA